MKILIPVFSPPSATYGSLTRMLALAKTFRAGGHEVLFCASGHVAASLERKGHRVEKTVAPTLFGLPQFISGQIVKRSQHNQLPFREGKSVGNLWFVLFLAGTGNRKYLKTLVRQELEFVKTFQPDLIFTEMDPGAYLIARITGIPLVATYSSLGKLGIGTFFWKKIKTTMNRVLKQYRLPETTPENLMESPKVFKIIPSIPELDDADAGHPDIAYVGNLLERVVDAPHAPFIPQSGQKYIYVYMGTGSVGLPRLKKVLPAVMAGMNDTVCIVASQTIARDEKIGNVHFTPYIQAEELLPHCIWTICHGGLNTITQSIELKVPLLIFPGPIFERRFNAAKVAANKAGFVGEFSNFNPEWIHDKLKRRAEILPQVAELSKRFASYHGARDVMQIIEKAMNAGK